MSFDPIGYDFIRSVHITSDIASGQVGSHQIRSGSISSGHIISDQVSSHKIRSDYITSGQVRLFHRFHAVDGHGVFSLRAADDEFWPVSMRSAAHPGHPLLAKGPWLSVTGLDEEIHRKGECGSVNHFCGGAMQVFE